MKQLFTFILPLPLLVLLSCSGGGGSGGSSSTPPASSPLDGVFVDSAVGGAYYRTSTLSGMTDDNGKFQCRSGEMVELFLKGDNDKEVILGSVECRATISPIDLVTSGRFDTRTSLSAIEAGDRTKIIKMLQLLQSLDTDGNAANGISLRPSDVTKLTVAMNISGSSLGIGELIDSENFQTELSDLMSDIGRTAVTESQAQSHFEETQAVLCESVACSPGDPIDPIDENPVIPPKSSPIVACMSGVTYGNSLGGVVGGTIYPINTSNGTFTSNDDLIIQTKVFMREDGSAQVYRQKSGDNFYKFNTSGYTKSASNFSSAATISINNIAFSNGNFTLSFGAESLRGFSQVRYATKESVGDSPEMNDNFASRRMWVFQTSDCDSQLPTLAETIDPTIIQIPNPPLPTVVQCLTGLMLAKTAPTGPNGAYEVGTTADFLASTGAPNENVSERATVRIILKTGGVAEFYRSKANNVFYKFANSGWTETAGEITVSSVQFSNSYRSLTFGVESDLAGDPVREAPIQSVGAGDLVYRRFSVYSSCSVPAFIKAPTF